MSGGDDWAPGDLALCVSHGPDPEDWQGNVGGPALGSINVVTGKSQGRTGVWLCFADWDAEFYSAAFRKIHPLTDEERDEFLADLRTPAPHTA